MSSFEIYKAAVFQYNKAMKYRSTISYNKDLDYKTKIEKNNRERKIQKQEYDKAIFYYKLYKAVSKLENEELKKRK